MILALAFLAGCVAFVMSMVNAIRRRPPAIAPFVTFPLIAALLGMPIVFEEEGLHASVVTGTPETKLEVQYIAWCPDRCVNVPDRFTQQLVLPNGFAYAMQIVVDPIAATRLVWNDLPQQVWPMPWWSHAVEAILRKHVEPVVVAYLQENEVAVLRRNSNSAKDRAATAGEILHMLQTRRLPFTDVRMLPPPQR